MPGERDEIAAALFNYEIGDEIGRGSFGVVYSAQHRSLGRRVAVKVLQQGDHRESTRERFVNEAKLIASLSHPHIVPVHDFVVTDTLAMLVMERLDQTLTERFGNRGIGGDEACAIALAACAALQAAHDRGVLHRDVKPDNLLFSADGQLKLADFGLAKLRDADSRLTQEGVILGTPAYMAPEQALGDQLSPATDVYSLAAVLYEMLSGAVPFEHATGERDEVASLAMLLRHVNERPRPLIAVAPHVPEAVAATVERALQRNPSDRYPSAEAFGVALAAAAAEAFGAGWLARTGVPVMGSTAIAAAAETTAAATSTAFIAPVKAGIDASPATEILSASELGGPTREAKPPAKLRRGVLVAVGAIVVIALGIGGAIALGGGADGDTEVSPASTSTALSPTSNAPPTSYRPFEKEFIEVCLARPGLVGNVKDPALRCSCLFDLTVASFPADRVGQEAFDQFRTNTTISIQMSRLVTACASNGK